MRAAIFMAQHITQFITHHCLSTDWPNLPRNFTLWISASFVTGRVFRKKFHCVTGKQR